jgi:hypothetical protein
VTKKNEINDMSHMMEQLKKKFISIKYDDIQNVKTLLQAYGVTYFEAPGEADILCAKLVTNNIVYACLSEDTDMFVYGCPRVLKYISLLNHTVVLYDMKSILNELEINQNIFREICILSGSDYDLQINKNNLYFDNLLDSLFMLYKKFIDSDTTPNLEIDIDTDSKIKYEFFSAIR